MVLTGKQILLGPELEVILVVEVVVPLVFFTGQGATAAAELYALFGARAAHTRQRTPRTFKGKTWQIY